MGQWEEREDIYFLLFADIFTTYTFFFNCNFRNREFSGGRIRKMSITLKVICANEEKKNETENLRFSWGHFF